VRAAGANVQALRLEVVRRLDGGRLQAHDHACVATAKARTSRLAVVLFGLSLGVLAVSLPVAAAVGFTGKVVGISDGDTITVLRGATPVKIRLDGVDCPESGQDFGRRAKQFTSALVFGKTVTVGSGGVDRYGRRIARVDADGQDVSLALVKAGLAWHYKQYSNDPVLARAEVAARAQRAGLWSEPNAMAPWTFRHPVSNAQNGSTTKGPFRANINSGVFHRPGCPHYQCRNCTRLFQTQEEAMAAGFRPARDCLQ
jgi:micrococcal nuclease